MTKKDDGGAAFPHVAQRDGAASMRVLTQGGMSLRDYFAGQAMAGAIALAADAVKASGAPSNGDGTIVAGMAYEYADAMLAERGKS